MNLPAWLEDLADHFGTQRLNGEITRQEAVTALRDKIVEKDDRTLILGVLTDVAAKALDSWHRQHQHPPALGTQAHLQMELFPDLAPRLYIRPGVTKPVMTLTAHDWDNAREMIRNRTSCAIEGAEADWRQFEEAYEKVRPLLSGDATTADIVPELRGNVRLEGLA